MILHGDCFELISTLAPNSVHAIVVDPPYGIGFMGCEYDTLGNSLAIEAWHSQWLMQCYRVLVPGGSVLAFSGTRTWHRLATAMEIAGYELKDTLMWLYGTGYPKAQDAGKLIDRKLKAKRPVIGSQVDVTAAGSPEAAQWEGWKIGGLKPMWEPVLWAIKPPEGTWTENLLRWGVGGIHVESCRIPLQEGEDPSSGRYPGNAALDDEAAAMLDEMSGELTSGFMRQGQQRHTDGGYHGGFPQDRIGERDTYGDTGGASRFFVRFHYSDKASRAEREAGLLHVLPCVKCGNLHSKQHTVTKEGEPDRIAKCIRNDHNAVKPISLMRWLIELVTAKGQTVLDPLCGSGSTLCAAAWCGREAIGIEKDSHYHPIAKVREDFWHLHSGALYDRIIKDTQRGLFNPGGNH